MESETEKEWVEAGSDVGLWLPEKPGEAIEGVVTRLETGLYGLQLEIEGKDGSLRMTPSHKALQARIKGFKVGDQIRIEFRNQELPKIKGHQGTRIYKVWVRK